MSILACILAAICAAFLIAAQRTRQRSRARLAIATNAICALALADAIRMYQDGQQQGRSMRTTRANVRAMLRNRYALKSMHAHIINAQALRAIRPVMQLIARHA